MHRKFRQRGPFLLPLLLAFVFPIPVIPPKNPYVDGASFEYSRTCDQLTCKIGEQCVNRKFWCNHAPCPSMTFCSKSRIELLKGPETCESVVCSPGYKCLVRVRDCEWNKKCKQRTARCVTEREYEDEPASCADAVCPAGHRCVLRETHCYRPPCKLTKSCAREKDATRWFNKCRALGCPSEHHCFLRRPPSECPAPPCDHVPDCLADSLSLIHVSQQSAKKSNAPQPDDRCRGWICPSNQECVVVRGKSGAGCELPKEEDTEDDDDEEEEEDDDVGEKGDNCMVVRTCRESMDLQPDILEAYHPESKQSDQDSDEIKSTPNWITFKSSSQTIAPEPKSTFQAKTTVVPIIMAAEVPSTVAAKKSHNTSENGTSSDSAWLTYLRWKAGVDAVRYWIERAKLKENFEGFVNWLDTVENLLGPDTYRLWLNEVELSSIDEPEFQSWLATARAPSRWPSILRDRSTNENREKKPATRRTSFPPLSVYYEDDKNKETLVPSDTYPKPTYRPLLSSSVPSFAETQDLIMITENPQLQHTKQPIIISTIPPSNDNNFDDLTSALPPPSPIVRKADFSPFITQLQHPQQQQQQQQPPYQFQQQQWAAKDSHDLAYGFPGYEAQRYGDSVKNSWKTWQTYYQLGLPNVVLPPPPPLLAPSLQNPVPPNVQAEGNSYYSSNYTRIRQNYSIAASDVLAAPLGSPPLATPKSQVFFPNKEESEELKQPQIQLNTWFPDQMTQAEQQPSTVGWDNRPDSNEEGTTTAGPRRKASPDDIHSLLDSVSGFQQHRHIKPNVLKLSPNHSQNSSANEQALNFLIYFPPPFNFIIYYGDKDAKENNDYYNQRHDEPDLHSSLPPSTLPPPPLPPLPFSHSTQSPSVYRQSSTNRENIISTTDSHVINTNDNENKPKPDNIKRREYIRKLLKELLKYWDEEEEAAGIGFDVELTSAIPDYENNHKNNNNKNRENDNKAGELPLLPPFKGYDFNWTNVDNSDAPLAKFFEWLRLNTSLLDLKPQTNTPTPQANVTEATTEDDRNSYEDIYDAIDLSPAQGSNALASRKVRVLVDIDRNPELMKVLFPQNTSDDKSKKNEYQVIVNLEDYVDQEEEELISRKLVDIVKYQLNRNSTKSKPMPKSLWVLPIYDKEINRTLSYNPSLVTTNDRLLTLKDVDFPTDAQSNGDLKKENKGFGEVESDYDGDETHSGETKVHHVTSRYKLHRYGG